MPSSSFCDDYIAAVKILIAALFFIKNELDSISVEAVRRTTSFMSMMDIFNDTISIYMDTKQNKAAM